MRNSWLSAVTVSVAFAVGCPMNSVADTPPKLSVGAWNIEWLGMPGQRTGAGKDVAQSPTDIAEYIKASKVDILAVEEVSYNEGTDDHRKNKTLELACAALNEGTGAAWKHRLFPKKSENSKDQSVGVMWNEAKARPKDLEPGKPYYRLEMNAPKNDTEHPAFLATANYHDRWVTAMKFTTGKGKTDVVIIPVHLKSNRGGAEKTRKQRHVEASMMVKAMPKVREKFHDDDLIILGDTNILKNEEPAVSALTANGFDDLNGLDMPTYLTGAPFDRVFMADDLAGKNKEFALFAQDVFKHPDFNDTLFKKRLSDHYMIRTSFDIVDDDDGE